jgi:hypothetical protein
MNGAEIESSETEIANADFVTKVVPGSEFPSLIGPLFELHTQDAVLLARKASPPKRCSTLKKQTPASLEYGSMGMEQSEGKGNL